MGEEKKDQRKTSDQGKTRDERSTRDESEHNGKRTAREKR